MGYTVKAAESADQALEIMREGDVDVALCDVRMPGHDGIWLLDQMRRFHPDIASVLATGLLEMDPMITLRPGVVGYIVKPFTREDLEKVVKRGMAERKRLQAEHRARPRRLPRGWSRARWSREADSRPAAHAHQGRPAWTAFSTYRVRIRRGRRRRAAS